MSTFPSIQKVHNYKKILKMSSGNLPLLGQDLKQLTSYSLFGNSDFHIRAFGKPSFVFFILFPNQKELSLAILWCHITYLWK